MERKSTRKRLTVRPTLRRGTVRKAAAAVATPEYSPHQIQEGFDFDLHDLSTDDVRFINRNYQNIYENEFHRQISTTIALHGVKAAADGDLEYVEKLLIKAAEFASTTKVHIYDLMRVCAADGWNMFHAAIIYKRMDVIMKILEYGTEIVQDPVEDEIEDTPLILAIKNFTSFLNPHDLTSESPTNLQVVKLLIDFGANVNVANKKGDTPLMYAVKIQLLEVVGMLTKMEMDPNVNARNAVGTTALHYAAAFDNKEIASILLQLNADIFISDKSGKTPVHIACKYGSRNVLKLIMDTHHQHVRKIVRDTDMEGNTPLMLAKSALNYSTHNIELLIACGSNLQAFNHNHSRILHFYSNEDDKEINENILHKEQSLLQHQNYDHETPLHVAAKYGHKDTCFLYAEKGADIYARDSSGFTPMMNAVANGHKEVAKIFFQFGYTVDTVVKQGKMLLEWAIELGYLSLIEAMADHNPMSIMDDTYKETNVIHYVCQLGNAHILQYLLEWDESRNITRTVTKSDSEMNRGLYPLHIAVCSGHMDCVKLLYQYGADLKVKVSERGDTALHIAARENHLEILKFLLNQGLDPETSNESEGTPLASAAHKGNDQIVAYLLGIGASANGSFEKYNLKSTPLLLAAKEGYRKVVKLLLEHPVDVSVATEEGHNCLVEAILNGHRCTAVTILKSKYWRMAMQFRNENNETPMRLLIEHMPDVAELALHRCVQRTYGMDEKGADEIVNIEYSYEFLDDFVTPKPTLNAFMADIFQMKSDDEHERIVEEAHPGEIGLESLKSPTVQGIQHGDDETTVNAPLESKDETWLQEKFNSKNHPLELMVEHKRTALLQTPVVQEMRDRKWKTFGLPVFTISIAMYILFLALLTAAVLVGPLPQAEMCNEAGCWSMWTSWSGCMDPTNSCNNSFTNVMERTRTCDQGFGIFDDCKGSSYESRSCVMDLTPGFIRVNPLAQVAGENSTAEFVCTVTGPLPFTPFTVIWMNSTMDELAQSSLNESMLNGNVTLTLRINVTDTSYQMYTCVGRNATMDTFVSASAELKPLGCQDQCHANLFRRRSRSCEERGISDSDAAFLTTADTIIIIFSVIQLLFECSEMWRRRMKYIIDLENWLEVLIFVLSIVFVIFHIDSECSCPDRTTWTLGVLAVFFGYMDLFFYLRRLPITGITISIMYNIFTTFLELILIAALLIFNFALPFYMLLIIPGRRTPFASLGRSMLKTLVMTTGEFEFDTIFINDQELVDEGLSLFITWLTALIWVIFIIVMPILFSNLLVGLAVGDTQEERAKAQLTKISLQVRLILELEDTMSVFRYYAKTCKRLFTREHTWYDFILGTTKIERREAELHDWEQTDTFKELEDVLTDNPLDAIKENLNDQKSLIANLQTSFEERFDRLEDQLSTLAQGLEESREIQSTRKDFHGMGSSHSLDE